MNRIERFFESTRRPFEKGGRLEKLWPFYESIESVFFSPARVSRVAPNVSDQLDVKRYMMLVIVALVPHYVFGVYNIGYQSHLASGLPTDLWPVIWTGLKSVVPIVIVIYVVGFVWETLFASVRKHEMSEGVLVTCALLSPDSAAHHPALAGGPGHLLRHRDRQGNLRRHGQQFPEPGPDRPGLPLLRLPGPELR